MKTFFKLLQSFGFINAELILGLFFGSILFLPSGHIGGGLGNLLAKDQYEI